MPKKLTAQERIATYPAKLWEIFDCAKSGRGTEMTLPAKNHAVNLRHRFHNFRRDMIQQGVPQAELMTNLSASIEEQLDGSCKLIFTYLDLGIPVPAVQPELTIQLDTQPQAKLDASAEDPAEDLTSKWLGKAETHTVETHKEAHRCSEWNQYDACVECGLPKSELK